MKNSRGTPNKEERLRSALEMIQAPEAKKKKQKEKTAQKRKAKDENSSHQKQTKRVKKNTAKRNYKPRKKPEISAVKEEPLIRVERSRSKKSGNK